MKKNIYQDLKDALPDCKSIDTHSHVKMEKPTANDLWEIISYHYIMTELYSAGLPADLIKSTDTAQDKVKKVLPYLKRIKNTVMTKILMDILRDLYQLEEPFLNEENWEKTDAVVQQKSKDPLWYQKILRDHAKVEKVFLPGYKLESRKDPFFQSVLRVDGCLEEIKNISFSELVIDFSRRYSRKLYPEVKNLILCLPADQEYEPVRNKDAAARTPGERVNLALTALCQLAQDEGYIFQLMLGVNFLGNRNVPYYNPSLLPNLTSYFNRYSKVTFDLTAAHINYSHEIVILAKLYPNVSSFGSWWYTFYPNYLKKILRERLEILPICKINGFFSDAYNLEWCYGKFKMAKEISVSLLSEMVLEGYFKEKEAIDIYRRIFYLNPVERYGL
ncbi:MAG: hypothetical protein GXP33_04750 [Spirochaetes bacterium]|nr:hypothetical protein [Spirochaetota bacterium]